jgi:CubicO group peptidase (beta-lactamase class C family)
VKSRNVRRAVDRATLARLRAMWSEDALALLAIHLKADRDWCAMVSGAVVVAVKDGRVLFSKGFGFADLARHRPMTADATLVNIASITRETSVIP